ncbi:MAG: hypothetical protein GY830_00980 [Bacteroidetes bacterium]|nr:hypothetical protein [Bacteroidota bacterium]
MRSRVSTKSANGFFPFLLFLRSKALFGFKGKKGNEREEGAQQALASVATDELLFYPVPMEIDGFRLELMFYKAQISNLRYLVYSLYKVPFSKKRLA